MKRITKLTKKSLRDFISGQGRILLFVWMPDRSRCQLISDELKEACRSLPDDLKIGKVNASIYAEIENENSFEIPRYILFSDGTKIARIENLARSNEIVRWVTRHLAKITLH